MQPNTQEKNNIQIADEKNLTREAEKKSDVKSNKISQEIHSHIEKDKTFIEQKLNNATHQLELYKTDHKIVMEKIAIQEQQIDSIADVVESSTTHFSNIGERQTKMDEQIRS